MASDLIFIIGRQRSGTTVFRELLAKHGAMDCNEIFHADLSRPNSFYSFIHERQKGDPRAAHPVTHRRLFHEFIRSLREKAAGRKLALDVKYFGLNLIPSPEDVLSEHPFIFRYIDTSSAHVIHVVRVNKVRVLVSETLSKKTGAWSAHESHQLVSNKPKVRIDPREALAFVELITRQDEVVRRLLESANGRELTYESMFDDAGLFTSEAVGVARDVLGVDQIDRHPRSLRMNPEPLVSLIQNFEEIEAAFTETPHSWMLDE